MTTSNKLKALALGLLSLASVNTFAGPPPTSAAVGTPAYDAWKASQYPAASLSGTAITTSVNNPSNATAPGCYFAPDASYTSMPGTDDGSVGPISIPFGFNFYGTTYTTCFINNNGNITFGSSTSSFSPAGFPSGTSYKMIAPFWADIDTRVGATVKYKIETHRIIITWPGVRRYNANSAGSGSLLNTFQCILTDGMDPGIGIGNNVAFYYGDMQWAYASSSGFGGAGATVGMNAGNGIDYLQIGRFNQSGNAYDGPAGNADGIDYLDYECFTFNVGAAGNQPPSVSGAPAGNTITIPAGTTATLNMSFLPPEVGQQVSTLINTGGLCNTVINTNTSGTVSNTSVSITGDACNVGTHHIIYTATDDFGTPASTTVDITVIVTPGANVPTISQWGLIILCLLSLTIGMIFIYKREKTIAVN